MKDPTLPRAFSADDGPGLDAFLPDASQGFVQGPLGVDNCLRQLGELNLPAPLERPLLTLKLLPDFSYLMVQRPC